jgi:hypothetical protein
VEGTWRARTSLSVRLPSSTLLLPCSLALAAVLVVVTEARVSPGAIACDAEGALAAGTTTWKIIGRENSQPAT